MSEFGQYMIIAEKTGEKSGEKILRLISENNKITTAELSKATGLGTTAIENNLKKLKSAGAIRRIGPAKGGHWEIIK